MKQQQDNSISHHKQFWQVLALVSSLLVCVSQGYAQSPIKMGKNGPDDPYSSSSDSWDQNFDDQWGLKRIGFWNETKDKKKNSVWRQLSKAKSPVVVAVIDTGLDYFHPDFNKDNLWKNEEETANGIDDDNNGFVDDLIGWNFVDQNNNPWDKTGHGTHSAGIIAAAINNGEGIAGMNPMARIMPLKVLNFLGRGISSGIAEAIFYAVNNGARIINLSLGGEYVTRFEQAAVEYANREGVIVVVASGNTASDTSNYGFAKLDSVITVAASTLDDSRAQFSNWGQDVNITAPGVDMLSLRARRTDFVLISGAEDYEAGTDFVGPENKYYRASGTSFAAPLVSGVASLIWSINPKLSAEQVTRMMLMSATDIEVSGWDQLTGYGLLNASAALLADPDYYTFAKINSITPVQREGALVVQVHGSADSSELREAWLELGHGKSPSKWKKVAKIPKVGIREGVLAELSPQEFNKGGTWSVRVMVKTKKHGTKEGWGTMDIQYGS